MRGKLAVRKPNTVDLFRFLFSPKSVGPDWAQTWDKIGYQPARINVWQSVPRGLIFGQGKESSRILIDGTRLKGYVSVKLRSGPTAWQIQCLNLDPDVDGSGLELLDNSTLLVGAAGGERIFLRLAESSPIFKLAKNSGFVDYAEETLYVHDSGLVRNAYVPEGMRTSVPSDLYSVFRLYSESVPRQVQSKHAITFDQWRDAMEPLGRSEHQWIYEEAGVMRGWLRMGSGKKTANLLEIVASPGEALENLDKMVSWAMQSGVHPNAPFMVLVADYQPSLARVLDARGFMPAGQYHIMVKHTVARAKNAALVPAGA